MSSPVSQLIESLGLEPHPEGGFFREIHRSAQVVEAGDRRRSAGTSIYYLLPEGSHSAWHVVASDEQWHHYAGAPLELHRLDRAGHQVETLGPKIFDGELAQTVVPAGVVQAARPVGGWALLGCTVSPGFDFDDFSLIEAAALRREFPEHARVIDAFV